MKSHKYLLLCLGLFSLQSSYAQTGGSLFDPSILHEIRLEFNQTEFWDSLTLNYQDWVADQSGDDVYTEASITIDGYELPSIGARFKGLASYYYVDGLKKPMKIDLNEFVEDQEYYGIKKFNLHNGACDPTMMRDFVAYDVLRKAGVKAPRMSHCKLFINDEFWGVYGIIEQIDKAFINENFADNDGTLIKNNGWSELEWFGDDPLEYQDDFQLKTNEETDDWSNFIHFLDVLNNADNDVFLAEFEKVFDINLYLHTLAIDVMLNNWDSYIINKRNWYLYHEPKGGKMHWIPWDYNLSLGGDVHSVGNPYPPIDPVCDLITDFSISYDDEEVTFHPKSNKETILHLWEFGDGQTSNEENPVHSFGGIETYNICYTGGFINQNGEICQQRRCKKIDLSFNPASCNTITNDLSPYPASDPIFQQVIAQDNYCCEDGWDAVCDLQYYEIYLEQDTTFDMGVAYDTDLPLVSTNPNKILIDRLLSIPSVRKKYFDITCNILENNFNADRLFPLIDLQINMIRAAIYEDPNYIFTWDYFEYDAGDGSGGGNNAEVPALKWVLAQRFDQVANDLGSWNQDCEDAFSPISWQDLAINELVASNNEDSGIMDPFGGSDDWIELFNNSAEEIDLTNFYLSDDSNDLFKWNFPLGTSILPGEFLIIWADKEEHQEGIHTNFKLSKSGESLFLLHEDGTLIDSLTFQEQITNQGYARIPNGIGEFSIQNATFGGNNEVPNSTKENFQTPNFKVFPNPTDGYLTIESALLENGSLEITNSIGQSVYHDILVTAPIEKIDLSHLPIGIYLITLIQNENHWSKKIQIE